MTKFKIWVIHADHKDSQLLLDGDWSTYQLFINSTNVKLMRSKTYHCEGRIIRMDVWFTTDMNKSCLYLKEEVSYLDEERVCNE